jgi:hypothetical protein
MKLLVMQLSPPIRHSIPLWSKYEAVYNKFNNETEENRKPIQYFVLGPTFEASRLVNQSGGEPRSKEKSLISPAACKMPFIMDTNNRRQFGRRGIILERVNSG